MRYPSLPLVEPRACPPPGRRCYFTACTYHVANLAGVDRPGRSEPEDIAQHVPALDTSTEWCSLRLAAQRPRSAEEVGALLGMTKRRVQQIAKAAFAKLRRRGVDPEQLFAAFARAESSR